MKEHPELKRHFLMLLHMGCCAAPLLSAQLAFLRTDSLENLDACLKDTNGCARNTTGIICMNPRGDLTVSLLCCAEWHGGTRPACPFC